MARAKRIHNANPLRESLTDYNDIDSLREEMSEWRDNIEENFSHTSKYEEVDEAANALEDGYNELESAISELETALKGTMSELLEDKVEVTYTTYTPYGKRGPSRTMRLSNQAASLEAAFSVIEDEISQATEGIPTDGDTEKVETLRGHLDEARAALETLTDVSFPGMF